MLAPAGTRNGLLALLPTTQTLLLAFRTSSRVIQQKPELGDGSLTLERTPQMVAAASGAASAAGDWCLGVDSLSRIHPNHCCHLLEVAEGAVALVAVVLAPSPPCDYLPPFASPWSDRETRDVEVGFAKHDLQFAG